MNKRKIITLLILIIALNSCKEKSIKSVKETHILEIKKAPKFHHGFKNSFQESPLNIDAERISLKEIFGILIETDTSNIMFENRKLTYEYYGLLIKQKDESQSINKIVLNEILDKLKLKLEIKKYKSYEIIIQDSLRYSNLINNYGDNEFKVSRSNDSIKIINYDLKGLTELLNSEYSEEIIYDNTSKRIDYSWEKVSFEKLKVQLQNDLGILFLDLKNDKSKFVIRSN